MIEHEDDEDVTYGLTEQGQRIANEVFARFTAGETIEEIAASYEMDVMSIRVLMAIDGFVNS